MTLFALTFHQNMVLLMCMRYNDDFETIVQKYKTFVQVKTLTIFLQCFIMCTQS